MTANLDFTAIMQDRKEKEPTPTMRYKIIPDANIHTSCDPSSDGTKLTGSRWDVRVELYEISSTGLLPIQRVIDHAFRDFLGGLRG